MDKEELFKMAVGLVQANINAGQIQSAMNFDTIIRDQVMVAFDALLDTWNRLNEESSAELH